MGSVTWQKGAEEGFNEERNSELSRVDEAAGT